MQSDPDDEDQQEKDAPQYLQETVDALEDRIADHTGPSAEQQPEQQPEQPAPAIEQDLDTDDLGSADAGSEPSG